jgi:hypothetical protein
VVGGVTGGASITDHGALAGLTDDDHTQYTLADGTRAFSGVVGGVTPTSSAHLTTKQYVDTDTAALLASGIADEANLVSVSGHLQSEIDAVESSDVDDVNSVTGSVVIAGAGEVSVSTTSQTITISGTPHTGGGGIVSAAMVGADGITVLSGTPTESETTISGFRDEFLSASGTFVEKAGDTMTGDLTIASASLVVGSGSASVNSIYFEGQPDTGFYGLDDHQIGVAIDGSLRIAIFDQASIFFNRVATLAGGSANAPQFTNSGEDTGLYFLGSDRLGLSTGGISALEITANQIVTVPSGLTVSGIPVTIGGLNNVVEDLTPQLGGDLDGNGHSITAVSGTFSESLTVSGTPVALGKPEWKTGEAVVSGTTDETSIISVGLPADTLGDNGILNFRLDGHYRNQSGAGRRINLKVYFGAAGGDLIYEDDTVLFATSANQRAFTLSGRISNINSTDNQFMLGEINISDNSPPTTGWGEINAIADLTAPFSSGPINFDTTSGQIFKITITHPAAHAALLLHIQAGYAWIT